jgi:hypothetical protein
MAAWAASGGGGRQLAVREGCTRWRGARGSDEEFKGGRAVLRGGSTAAEMVAQWGRWAEEEERRLHGGGGHPI